MIDTHVLISAMLSANGAPARLLRHVLGHGLPVFSPSTFEEVESRLWKPKFDRYLGVETRKRLLHDLNAVAHWVDLPAAVTATAWSRDPDDDKFVHTAIAAAAPWLVSGDRDLIDIPSPPHGLSIVSPAQAVRLQAFGGLDPAS